MGEGPWLWVGEPQPCEGRRKPGGQRHPTLTSRVSRSSWVSSCFLLSSRRLRSPSSSSTFNLRAEQIVTRQLQPRGQPCSLDAEEARPLDKALGSVPKHAMGNQQADGEHF